MRLKYLSLKNILGNHTMILESTDNFENTQEEQKIWLFETYKILSHQQYGEESISTLGGVKMPIFALGYNTQFWSYKHAVNIFLVAFGMKKSLKTFSERSEF